MLLRVDQLHVQFDGGDGAVGAVSGVALEIGRGQTVALVGESGCGKTVTALSILRLLPHAAGVASGTIEFHDQNLLTLTDREMRAIRGNRIAMIFQEPMTSLNPVLTIGQQIGEVLTLHRGLRGRALRDRTIDLLRRVGIPAPDQRRRAYPHELSGGMRQRVMIAMALACEPELLIADEPTTALDVTLQAQILDLLRDLQRETGMAILFITHDLGVVAQIGDVVCVMYAGRIVERAAAGRFFAAPQHPYALGLLRCAPRLAADPPDAASPAGSHLPVIPGEVPDPRRRPSGCPFHPRCDAGHADPACQSSDPPLRDVASAHACACWHARGYPSDERCRHSRDSL